MLARTGCPRPREFRRPDLPDLPDLERPSLPSAWILASLLPIFARDSPRLRICLRETSLCFRYTLYVGAPLRLYVPGGMCAQRCAGSFFKDSIDAPVNERASSIKRIVKNASTPMQIARPRVPLRILRIWGVSGILAGPPRVQGSKGTVAFIQASADADPSFGQIH